MRRNLLSYTDLEKIITITKTINVDKNTVYNYFKTFKYIDEPKNSTVLYFPIYVDKTDDQGGWYPRKSDTRNTIDECINKHPEYTYVLDEKTYNRLNNSKLKVIIVPDIMKSIDDLFNYFYSKNKKFKTILVTGSVGKTTTVGLIKDVIKNNVLRIYAKRITPIVLKSNLINYLTEDIEYLVLEASLFYKHHVKYFSETLKPYISICLNILPEHIGIDGIKNVEDITKCKSEVFKYSKYALINMEDKELSKIKFDNHKMIYNDYEMDSNVEKVYDISKLNPNINIYLKTYISRVEYSSAYYVGMILGIPEKIVINRLNNAIPVEYRVNKNNIFNKEVIFDGDVSGVARFSMFTNHFYGKAILVIRYLTLCGEEDEDYSKFPQYYDKFEKIYLFDDLECLDVLKNDKTIIVSNHDFIKTIDKDVQIFYHYGSYYRRFNEFSIDNLGRVDI